jgi:NADP-dependent 3-hydroxy acid dehydrogenase YdfG
MSFRDKRIFITGAGRGLGAAFAVCLADQGADLLLTGRNNENLAVIAEQIRLRTGKRPETQNLDLADISAVTLYAKKLRDEGKPIDILINNGAQWHSGPMTSHDALSIVTTITGNVAGTLLLTRGLLPLIEKAGGGDIVNIVSVSGLHNVGLQGASVAYIASKHGQAGFTDALRQEMRGRNVRVIGIYPPNIRDISPLDEQAWNEVPDLTSWATNRDIVETVFFALSRPRHLSVASIMVETDTSNFQGR